MARDWISETDRKRDGRSDQVFMITDRRSGEIIGAIALMGFTREHSHAKIGYWIGRPLWNRGYATEAVCAVLDYGFRVIGLHRIYAFSLSRNKASGRVMEKCGMRHEGCYGIIYRKPEILKTSPSMASSRRNTSPAGKPINQ